MENTTTEKSKVTTPEATRDAAEARFFRSLEVQSQGRREAATDNEYKSRSRLRAIARKKATRRTAIRILTAMFLCAVVVIGCHFDLVSPVLVGPVITCVCVWLAFWLGAYVQYYFAKGGFMNVTTE